MSDGKPVINFDIRAWQEGLANYDLWTFRDRPNGSFELGDLPVGNTFIVATAPNRARSQLYSQMVVAGDTAQLNIELPSFLVGSGVVVDATDATPIPGAHVQACLHAGGFNLGPVGGSVLTDSAGRFSFHELCSFENVLKVTADGYSPLTIPVMAHGDSTTPFDIGILPLQRGATICARVVLGPDDDAQDYLVGLSYHALINQVALDSGARACFPDISPGMYSVDFTMPFGVYGQVLCQVAPRASSQVTIDYRVARHLQVIADAVTSAPVSGKLWARTSFLGESHALTSITVYMDAVQGADLGRISADRMVVDVLDDTGAILATKWITSDRNKPETVHIAIGRAPMVLKVVDETRKPLPGVDLQLQTPGDGAGWQLALRTDANGEAKTGPVEAEHVSILLTNPTLGQKWFKDVSIPTEPETPIELVLDAKSTLQVVALDRDTPLRALTLEVLDPIGGDYVFTSMISGDDGRARYRPVAKQPFRVRVQANDLWQVTDRIEPTEGDDYFPVQVRRLGSVQFRATMLGSPLKSKVISVRSLEFDRDVSDWVTSGRVQASSTSLRCDEEGKLRIDGLPNGPYRWSAQDSSAQWVSGEFTIPPRGLAPVEVSLP